MICKQCGATVADNHQFCPYCGNAMSAPEAPPQESISFDMPQAYQPITPQFKTCSNCGTTISSDTRFCPICGQSNSAESTPTSVAPGYPDAPVKKKKKHGVAITLSIIAGILVIAFVAGWLTNWFGFYGPAAKIYKAAEKTLESGNFTLEITSGYEYDGREESETMHLEFDIDIEKRALTVVVANEDDEIVGAIYDGYKLDYYDYGEYGSGYEKTDISDQLDKIFDAIEEAEDFDLEEFLEDYLNFDELDDIVDIKKMEKSLKSMDRNLNSNSWLKKNAGYSKEKVDGATVYTFNPDLYNLATATLEEFEVCFEDEDDYEDLTDLLKDVRSDLRDIDVTVSVGVKSGKLSSFEFTVEDEDGDYDSTEIKFKNVGGTKVDTDTLEDILDSATDDRYSSFYDYY